MSLVVCMVGFSLLQTVTCPTEWGTGFTDEHMGEDAEINFERCSEIVCDPLRVIRYTNAIKEIQAFYRRYHRPANPMSLEAKFMVVSNILRNVFKEVDFVGFYFLNKERSTSELEIAPYSTIIKTPMPLFKKGEGIVGAAWEKEDTIWVKDISKDPQWTTFDGRARSEIAVPCFDLDGNVFAVMFLYSELRGVFEETDAICLEEIVNYLDY